MTVCPSKFWAFRNFGASLHGDGEGTAWRKEANFGTLTPKSRERLRTLAGERSIGVGNWYFSPARQAEAVNLEWECKKVA